MSAPDWYSCTHEEAFHWLDHQVGRREYGEMREIPNLYNLCFKRYRGLASVDHGKSFRGR